MPRDGLASLPPFATTAIGSLPQPDPAAALALLDAARLDIPCWPQLPQRSFLELMVPQAARPMPFLAIDETARRVRAVPPDVRPQKLAQAYEWILAGAHERFALSPVEAAAWPPFLAATAACPAVKGQLTGPVTLGLGALDEQERPIFFDADLRDAAVQATASAARAQAAALGADRRLVLVSADEPTLGVLGTAGYLGVTRDDALGALAATLGAIREAGAVAGVHCCGAADWELVLEAGADVLFADAFAYGSSLVAAARALGPFLARGGRIGWGLAPTDDAHAGASVDEMRTRYRETEEALVRAGLDRDMLRARSLLTPACGCGSLRPAQAADVFVGLARLRDRLRAAAEGRD
jgi:methionine synthase II (cobalamin-independent)